MFFRLCYFKSNNIPCVTNGSLHNCGRLDFFFSNPTGILSKGRLRQRAHTFVRRRTGAGVNLAWWLCGRSQTTNPEQNSESQKKRRWLQEPSRTGKQTLQDSSVSKQCISCISGQTHLLLFLQISNKGIEKNDALMICHEFVFFLLVSWWVTAF